MYHQTTTEQILEAAEKCSQVRETLQILFPEAFEDCKPFCTIRDVFIRKGMKGFYQVVEYGNFLTIFNLSTGKHWENKIIIPYGSNTPAMEKTISRKDMRTLLAGQIKNLEVLKVLSIDDLQKWYF